MLYSINWSGRGTATCFRFAPLSHVKGDTTYSMVKEQGLNCERIFLLHTTLQVLMAWLHQSCGSKKNICKSVWLRDATVTCFILTQHLNVNNLHGVGSQDCLFVCQYKRLTVALYELLLA